MTALPPKKVLHVGCGPLAAEKLHESFHGDDWTEVRLDINPGAHPDIVASITDMSAVASGTFDALYSSHNLEHLFPHELPLALREFYRVLKQAGYALITLPDLQQIAECIAAGREEDTIFMTNKGPIAPLDMLYGFRPFLAANPFMAHKFGYTAATLHKALREAGFLHVRVERDGEFNLWAVASPTHL
ncbi:MAG: class I SAM-dependent methyltransferase [Desulfovibrio sp.]|jgi:SAM-dependent methyltransferase|nr:class I SAM-dependent methyltransferase [Desulfovibrio sp.]